MRAWFAAVLFASGLWACAESADHAQSSDDTGAAMPEVDEAARPIARLPAAEIDYRPVSLCELIRFYHQAAGEYVVAELVTRMEHDPLSDSPQPFTYARLETIDDWTSTGPPPERVLRVRGGVFPDGSVVGGDIALELNEPLTAFFRQAGDENAGYLQATGLTVFLPTASGGLTNGQLFVNAPITAAGLRELFDANTQPDLACRRDVAPERRARVDGEPLP